MNQANLSIHTALLSVSDKTGIVELAQALAQRGVTILSTGGTAKALQAADVPITLVSERTGFPEIMEGRVKTLHPKIHGGILGKRDEHQAEAKAHDIEWIDLVVCNLYPFAETIAKTDDFATAIENIDIGGPSMVRAAAKNLDWVTVLTDADDYGVVIDKLDQGIDPATRKRLSAKAFAHTAQYDAMIAAYMNDQSMPETFTLGLHKQAGLRYGENPHQQAAWYTDGSANPFGNQLQGKELSYNNLADSSAALACLAEFDQPACVVVKHANPCGVAVATDIDAAFEQAWAGDSKSAFGGIVALNRPCTEKVAAFLADAFVEIVLAPGYDQAALAQFAKKPNYRIMDTQGYQLETTRLQLKQIAGGMLMQTPDDQVISAQDVSVVTKQQPSDAQLQDMLFAWPVVKHIKSNAIVIVEQHATRGVGAGQVSRVDAVELAIKKAGDELGGAVLASDAFFPFSDSIEYIAQAGIRAIIQPGGSVRDEEVIAACDAHGITMVFTGQRCFNH